MASSMLIQIFSGSPQPKEKKMTDLKITQCLLCHKQIKKDKAIQGTLTINLDSSKSYSPAKFLRLPVHLPCLNKLYERIGKATEMEKKQIDQELIGIAEKALAEKKELTDETPRL